MKITLDTGLMNCILRGRTVILDFVNDDGEHERKYHTYKTEEKAEYMWQVFGRDCHRIKENA